MSYGAIGTVKRDSDGKLPSVAFPGGYPILYLDGHNVTLCSDCATTELDTADPFDEKDKPTTFFLHYEGPSDYCAKCNKETESAYGDPDEEESDEEGGCAVGNNCEDVPCVCELQ